MDSKMVGALAGVFLFIVGIAVSSSLFENKKKTQWIEQVCVSKMIIASRGSLDPKEMFARCDSLYTADSKSDLDIILSSKR